MFAVTHKVRKSLKETAKIKFGGSAFKCVIENLDEGHCFFSLGWSLG